SVNVDRARREGYELAFDKIFTRWFSNRFTYTFLENRGIPPGFTDSVILRLSPRHTANYQARFLLWKKLEMDHVLRYASGYYEGDDLGGSKMSSTVVWDVR